MKRLLIFSLLVLVTLSARAQNNQPAPPDELWMPALFSDHMVLQRNQPVPVWGSAEPGTTVRVMFKNQQKQVMVESDGSWRINLDEEPAGGPFELTIIAGDTLQFDDVMVGEVWLASGQSNMEMPLAGWGKINNYKQEIAEADYSDIRLFTVEHTTSPEPLKHINNKAGWLRSSPETIPQFSATAYFFGRNIHRELGIPVGLIHSSWGGTIVEAWTSREMISQFPEFGEELTKLEKQAQNADQLEVDYNKKIREWKKRAKTKDRGFDHGEAVWAEEKLNTANWNTMELPTLWEEAGLNEFDGVVWFRKTVDLSADWSGSEVELKLGPIDDNDITWVNGQRIGATDGYTEERSYAIPAELLKAGENSITVRVVDTGGGGGLYGDAQSMKLENEKGVSIVLSGSWTYKVGVSTRDLPDLPMPSDIPNRPIVLYNGMIHPLIPYQFRGAIWYQGESNASRAYQYRKLFKGLISDWRDKWNEDFPFLFVQLANWKERLEEPAPSEWAELREAQAMALELPNTGMAVTIDIGNPQDIHPKNKQEVGRRLALLARHKVYGEEIVASGPTYQSMKVEGSQVRLSFDHVDGGMTAHGSDGLKGFAIAGPDSTFHWAEANIESDQVVVWSERVDKPLAVRYGWADNPACNLYNKAGLPAAPFRTDDWPGVTKGEK